MVGIVSSSRTPLYLSLPLWKLFSFSKCWYLEDHCITIPPVHHDCHPHCLTQPPSPSPQSHSAPHPPQLPSLSLPTNYSSICPTVRTTPGSQNLTWIALNSSLSLRSGGRKTMPRRKKTKSGSPRQRMMLPNENQRRQWRCVGVSVYHSLIVLVSLYNP